MSPCVCLQNLSRRGLHGTALEYAKLLLGLDPSDPKGVLFCIDYLAIRAHQYSFIKVTQSSFFPVALLNGRRQMSCSVRCNSSQETLQQQWRMASFW